MSKGTNNRIISANKSTDSGQPYRKCSFHVHSPNYAANMLKHDEIIATTPTVPPDAGPPINILVVFHFLAPNGTYNKDRVLSRAHEIVMALNDDFNNYSANLNTMNNFRYKSIVNQVFTSNMAKQSIYLGPAYLELLPVNPSNITFELGEVYFYPVRNRLSLSKYDDQADSEIQHQVIKQYIHQNRADAISPDNFLNVWVIDVNGSRNLGYANFPWEATDNYHGIVITRRVFFPEDYGESNYDKFKTVTHQTGHYLGLLHVANQDNSLGAQATANINTDVQNALLEPVVDRTHTDGAYDPTDRNANRRLQTDPEYNPLFMNFMDFTYDKYVSIFTHNQIIKMRSMLLQFRPGVNSLVNNMRPPIPKYNPETDTTIGTIGVRTSRSRQPSLVPSHEVTTNPRLLSAQGYLAQQPQIPLEPVVAAPIPPSNLEISQLAPNLFGNNLAQNSHTTSREQIIANIQKTVPADPVGTTQEAMQKYHDSIKNYQTYTSANGYAYHYPYDDYSSQQYHQPMVHLQQRHDLPDSSIHAAMAQTPVDPATIRHVDPRTMQPLDPITMQPVDPRAMQPADPQAMHPVDPRTMPPTNPRTMHPMYPIDPRMMYPAARPMPMVDPRLMMPWVDPRLVPQARKPSEKKCIDPNQPNLLKQKLGDNEINHEAVSNLMNRNVQRHLQGTPMTNGTELVAVAEVAPSNLVNKVSNVNDQLQTIRTALNGPPANNFTGEAINAAAKNDSKSRNKYGQLANVPSKNPRSIATQTKRPQTNFVRTRPQ